MLIGGEHSLHIRRTVFERPHSAISRIHSQTLQDDKTIGAESNQLQHRFHHKTKLTKSRTAAYAATLNVCLPGISAITTHHPF